MSTALKETCGTCGTHAVVECVECGSHCCLKCNFQHRHSAVTEKNTYSTICDCGHHEQRHGMVRE